MKEPKDAADASHLHVTHIQRKSKSVESDADIDVDEDELFDDDEDDNDIYSSDEEWEYEKREETESQKPIKTPKKENKSSSAEALNKEIEIMKEIIGQDREKTKDLDLELCELLASQEYGATIDRQKPDPLFEIKKTKQQPIKSIEVIDIANEVTENKNKTEEKVAPQQIVFPWEIRIRSNWATSDNKDEIKIQDDENLLLNLQNIKPGSYKFKFLINGTSFCDESLPHEQDYLQTRNTFILWSNNFHPKPSLTINTQVIIPWQVQLTGNWPGSPTIVDCKVNTNGDVVAMLPALSPGTYDYHFLINNSRFVDESKPVRQEYLTNHNTLVVKQGGEVVWD